jgi:1-acyl-sn-glycerol-3-phosphate acyltransferase
MHIPSSIWKLLLRKQGNINTFCRVTTCADPLNRAHNAIEYPSPVVVGLMRAFAFTNSTLFSSIRFNGVEHIPNVEAGGLVVVGDHTTYFDPAWMCN